MLTIGGNEQWVSDSNGIPRRTITDVRPMNNFMILVTAIQGQGKAQRAVAILEHEGMERDGMELYELFATIEQVREFFKL